MASAWKFSAFFLNTAYALVEDILLILSNLGNIPQSVTPGIVIINLITTIFCRKRIQSSQRALDWEVNLAEETPGDVHQQYEYGLEFSFI